MAYRISCLSTARALCAVVAVLGCSSPSTAAVIVAASIVPQGNSYHYEFTVTNQELVDIVLVSLPDAPLFDPLIAPSLSVPPGFLGSYDAGLGYVDFLEGVESFTAGSTHGPFSFVSLSAPGAVFARFEVLTAVGDLLTGCVLYDDRCLDVTPVPEPPTWMLLALGSALVAWGAIRGRRGTARGPFAACILLACLAAWSPLDTQASSHSDAPLVKQDPQVNLTDVYAFVGSRYDGSGQRVLNVLVSVRPFSDPGDGATYDRFADDALYTIHVTHPVTGVTTLRYDFRFSSVTGVKNPNTLMSYGRGNEIGPIQSIGDARQNYTQTYGVTRNGIVVASGLPVPPPNVGLRVTPSYNDSITGKAISGAADFPSLDTLTRQGVMTLDSGEAVWAGPREDGFYADTPGLFDLLDGRILDNDGDLSDGLGQDGGGVDGFKGFNVLTFALQIPVQSLQASAYTALFADLASALPSVGPAMGVGVYATVSRPRTTLRRTDGAPISSGPWIQLNRLGNPLFNEAFVALRDKDRYNRTSPTGDAAAFATYASNPELAVLVNTVFGTAIPATSRSDLAALYMPDVLRVDTTTPPVRLPGQAGFSRLGFLGGDVVMDGAGRVKSGGWPNGRRPGDDVVDVALSALASGPTYAVVVVIGDNVAANDQLYHRVFPYLGTPFAGPTVEQRKAP